MDNLHKNMTAIEWSQWLVKQNTITPSSNEHTVLKQIASVLEDAGFTVDFDFYDPENEKRCSICAQINPNAKGPTLCIGGHIDTVPLGNQKWEHAPFLGEIIDGYLYGRGSCDMKSGVGALLEASLKIAPQIKEDQNFMIQLYGGEEINCLGSYHMAQTKEYCKNITAAVICEPSCSKPLLGHRGCLWLKLSAKGKTAHACMPHKGDNALIKLLKAVNPLTDFQFTSEHEILGKSTFVISTLHSGLNTNSVPDYAEMTIDMRTIPSQDNLKIVNEIKNIVGSEINAEVLEKKSPLWTEPSNEWVKDVYSIFKKNSEIEPIPASVQFVTDGASLREILPNCPIIILGPGDTEQAHQLNERCEVEQIKFVEYMYELIIRDFYHLN